MVFDESANVQNAFNLNVRFTNISCFPYEIMRDSEIKTFLIHVICTPCRLTVRWR